MFSFVLSELPDEGGGILVRRNPLKEVRKKLVVHLDQFLKIIVTRKPIYAS